MPLDLRWDDAAVLSNEQGDYVVVPIVESLIVFSGEYKGHRRLIISKEGGEVTGRIVEFLLKGAERSANEVNLLCRDVYQSHLAGNWYSGSSLNGLVAFYNKDNLFMAGKNYVDGVVGEDAWINFELDSETPYGNQQRLSCFRMVLHMTTSSTDQMVAMVCYVYNDSPGTAGDNGGTGSNPGGQNPGGYPVGGGPGSPANPGTGYPPVSTGGGGYGGNNPNALKLLTNRLLASKTALFDNCPIQLWLPLINFQAPQAVLDRLDALSQQEKNSIGLGNLSPIIQPDWDWQLQALEDAAGTVLNMDEFSVIVNAMPTVNNQQLTPSQLLSYIRLNLNSLVTPNTTNFQPHPSLNNESSRWLNNPFTSIVSIGISAGPLQDNGSVIVSEYTNNHWNFSTIRDPYNAHHPVSGTRQFGYEQLGSGAIKFYVRGVDRVTLPADEWIAFASQQVNGGTPIQFTQADALWHQFQQGLKNYVDANGGSATVVNTAPLRPNWAQVLNALRNNRQYVPCP
ncbi:hypothetical protein EJV47_10535 [Hymenobacter gummosus]|uniref:Uncharacterized protein n=1 Tax=Hymenobacter gummosus TaxID=1776032 RepID=A0A3S0QIB6_9BACT|nr:hypothetical protein [Hymenobacter gummosus]RTQ50069.1 hypothetical protein EJV47_10535 [Hymenobacter gummosus]